MQKQARRSALLHSGDHDGKWTHGKTAFVLCLPLYALENGYQHLLNRSDARGWMSGTSGDASSTGMDWRIRNPLLSVSKVLPGGCTSR
jgi:hypothetical protein